MLSVSEDWVKDTEDWPANLQKRKREEEEKQREKDEKEVKSEHERKRGAGENKHHDAYASGGPDEQQQSNSSTVNDDQQRQSEDEKLHSKYSDEEIALLRCLQHEKAYVSNLEQNDGRRRSPVAKLERDISIDEADQFSPDNWIPRSTKLIRLTGKHPLNGEPELSALFDAGLVTPNELHYVRNHGPVPHLRWETHQVEVSNVDGCTSRIGMDELSTKFNPINIQVALACDGNRRKELNMIKRSKGFNWGPGAASCAYWKGALLRDVLHSVGIKDETQDQRRYWVHFEGAEELSEGKYATCIPLPYAMDPTHDVMLAYEMNDLPLPPDHGYPVRILIPGYVGGRSVKWLRKVWVSDQPNESHYHIWDNRVLPSFISEMDGEFASTMFAHPDTACNEQNLNSVITKPRQGETMDLTQARSNQTFRVEGYAYDGGGHEVQRVEVSLDDGKTWLYCIRKVGSPLTTTVRGTIGWCVQAYI